jgi:hypothetical protein
MEDGADLVIDIAQVIAHALQCLWPRHQTLLESFPRRPCETDVMNDFREIAMWIVKDTH